MYLYKNIHMYVHTHIQTQQLWERGDPETPRERRRLATPGPSRPAPSIALSIPRAGDPDPASPARIPGPGPAVYLLPAPHALPAAPIGSRPSAGREGRPRLPIRRLSRRSARVPAYAPLSSNRREERAEDWPIGRRLSPPARCPLAACEAAAPPWWGGGGRGRSFGSRGVPEWLELEWAVKVIQFQPLA